jgi:pimeloyl-ACP methyl ester carboxylesterase
MRIVEANGVELCIDTFGDPGDPAILLAHGAGNCLLAWADGLCERLAAGGRHVIRYDMRDAGRSVSYPPGPPGYVFADLVEDAAGLIDALGVERAHVVGMSLGGMVAQLLALDHPDRVATLTLASTTPGGGDLPGVTPALMEAFANEPPAPDWTDRAAVVDYLVEAERPFSPYFDEVAARETAERVADHTANPASMANGLEDPEPWRHRLGEIRAPTLVVHGTEDPLFPYAHAVALADEIPGAELLPLQPMGHEYFPPATWDVVVPAILRHTAGGERPDR